MDRLNWRSAFPGKREDGREVPPRAQAGTQGLGRTSMSRRGAIQKAPGRLGMQASNREIVASLAEFGMDVAEGLVRQVKVEVLKGTAKVERQQAAAPDRSQRRQFRLSPKLLPSRERTPP
jgi:hypothetical protein